MKKILLIVLTLISISVNAQVKRIEQNYYTNNEYESLFVNNSQVCPKDTLVLNSGNFTIDYQYDSQICEIIINVKSNTGDEPVNISQIFYNTKLYYKRQDDSSINIYIMNNGKCIFICCQYIDNTIDVLLPNAYVFGI